jgi:hypothetical protein
LAAPGVTTARPTVASAPARRPPPGGEDGRRERQHRVAPVDEPGRAGVVARTGERQRPAAVRPDRRGDAQRRVQLGQGTALLDVQLEEHPDPRQRLGVATERGGIDARSRHRGSHRHARRVAQPTRSVRVERTGEQSASGTGHPEAPALLVGEDDDGERAYGRHAPRAEQVDREQRRDDAERPVVRAATRHAVEMAAGDDGAGPRLAPPCPQVAVAVGRDGQPAATCLVDEPRPRGRVRGGPGEPGVAAGLRVATDPGQRAPAPVERVVDLVDLVGIVGIGGHGGATLAPSGDRAERSGSAARGPRSGRPGDAPVAGSSITRASRSKTVRISSSVTTSRAGPPPPRRRP